VSVILNVPSTRLVCATVVRMLEAVSVRVPEPFAEELASAGFRKVRRLRVGGFEPVLTFIMTSATLAADAATILVAKDAASSSNACALGWLVVPGLRSVVSWLSKSPGALQRPIRGCAWSPGVRHQMLSPM
jgi:hypothetical protein